MQKVLLDEVGLSYICATAERFYAVSTVLCNMVTGVVDCPSNRLLKHVVRSANPKLGFRVWSLGFRVWAVGFRVYGAEKGNGAQAYAGRAD